MASVLDKKKTVQDYLNLPEGAPYQLLKGELIISPSPNRKHQQVIGKLYRSISAGAESAELGEVYIGPLDVYLDDENVAQPDIFFFSKERLHLLSDRGAEAAPDLVIEVLSPSNAYYDLRFKLDLYEKYGVNEYFIVDPEDNTVTAYKLIDNKFVEQYREKNMIRSAVLQSDFTW